VVFWSLKWVLCSAGLDPNEGGRVLEIV
jgi:hypothetical protein